MNLGRSELLNLNAAYMMWMSLILRNIQASETDQDHADDS